MKLSTENGIRSFLIRISKHCNETNCDNCPFYELDADDCTFLFFPYTWDVNKIMESYKNIE